MKLEMIWILTNLFYGGENECNMIMGWVPFPEGVATKATLNGTVVKENAIIT